MEHFKVGVMLTFAQGPGEIACFHPDAFAVLEAPGTKCIKSDFYDLLYPGVFTLWSCRNKSVHDARRTVWSKALGVNGASSEFSLAHNLSLSHNPNARADDAERAIRQQ